MLGNTHFFCRYGGLLGLAFFKARNASLKEIKLLIFQWQRAAFTVSDEKGVLFIHAVCMSKRIDVMEYLIKSKQLVDINAQDTAGQTPLVSLCL